MINEVRVYDGQGQLKKTVKPQLDFDNIKKFKPHGCRRPSCLSLTTNRHYCSDKCRSTHRELRENRKREEKREKRARLKDRYCSVPGCNAVLSTRRTNYCSKKCTRFAYVEARIRRDEAHKIKLKKLKAKIKKGKEVK